MVEQAHTASWNAEAPKFGMPALWRLAIWGGLAALALFAAAVSAYSNAGSQRLAPSIPADQVAAGQGTVQPRPPAAEAAARPSEEEARRLAQTVRSLAA